MARKALSAEEKLRKNQKQLALTWSEIQTEIDRNDGNLDKRCGVRGTGKTVRVIVRVRSKHSYGWAMAIVSQPQGRIDEIDWELRVEDHRGKTHNCSGWHRHMWKPAGFDKHKEYLPAFRPTTVKEFILTGFKILNVQLKKGASYDRDRKLPLD